MLILKNDYKIKGEKLIIYLNRRNGDVLETVTDLKFLDKLMLLNVKWYAKWKDSTQSFYVQASQYFGIVDGKPKRKNIYLHKYILDSPTDEFIDHIEHDTLNNCEANLRSRNNHQNILNRRGANKNNMSGHRNVAYLKKEDKYLVQLQIDGRNTIFGKFNDLEEAVRCAVDARKKYYEPIYEFE